MFWRKRTQPYADDKRQQRLAELICELAVFEVGATESDKSNQLALFLLSEGWSRDDCRRRIDDALTTSSTLREATIHECAALLGRRALTKAFD
jgi:hypothetical protein